MKFSRTTSTSLALLLQSAHLATAQTPPSSQPSTSGNLIVAYNGTSVVETDMLLFPDRTSLTIQPHPTWPSPAQPSQSLTSHTEVSTRPSISLDSRVSGKHMLVFADLSISGGRYNGTSLPLAQGLQSCRTTRLHWLQTGLTQAENETFVVEGATPALAPYGKPDHFPSL